MSDTYIPPSEEHTIPSWMTAADVLRHYRGRKLRKEYWPHDWWFRPMKEGPDGPRSLYGTGHDGRDFWYFGEDEGVWTALAVEEAEKKPSIDDPEGWEERAICNLKAERDDLRRQLAEANQRADKAEARVRGLEHALHLIIASQRSPDRCLECRTSIDIAREALQPEQGGEGEG